MLVGCWERVVDCKRSHGEENISNAAQPIVKHSNCVIASQSLLDVTVIVADGVINAVKHEQRASAYKRHIFTQEPATMRFQGKQKETCSRINIRGILTDKKRSEF